MKDNENAPKGISRNLLHITKELIYALIGGILIAILFQTFLFKPFFIPSESMEPTLLVGDTVVVSKQAYNFGDISRGDVIVFEDVNDWMDNNVTKGEAPSFMDFLRSGFGLGAMDHQDYITKRVIGLPGDVVSSNSAGKIKVNGDVVDEEYLPPGVRPASVEFTEVIPNDNLWVMGDNRPVSADSLYHSVHGGVATVSIESVVGKVVFVIPAVTPK